MGNSIEMRALRWALAGRVGASSKALAAFMVGVENDKSHPWDGGDFLRCVWLLREVPEWRARLGEMAAVSPYWAVLVPHWSELDALMERGENERVYRRMRELFEPVEKKNRDQFSLGAGVSVRVRR